MTLFVPNRDRQPNRQARTYDEQQHLWRWRTDVAIGLKREDAGGPLTVKLASAATYQGLGVYVLASGETWDIPDHLDEPCQPYAVFHQSVWDAALAHICEHLPVWGQDLALAGAPGAALWFQAEAVLTYAQQVGREVFTPHIPTPDDHVDETLAATAHLAALTGTLVRAVQVARDEN
ncbi:hypothetical protein [Deinococcus soli (ex Cha et al. 2016)]|uniref:Uncharacterized protein n=2 Tax=Deinococcus soli (ex Cha et al. 2016) TaxID=1309411 RepID=A0ACC6KL05_9DEIO|nr:hypothetical protein [Deinococcus soli (ex Cha et al. 2016)]MDR6218690.1 hypothetical protein [Deinococcus soli (ex Cha et al. 2016)]MDR6328487.1 hypothetical protein [Deinococcus soli (ex Cha et al. 2016)]MDR6753098.1 hypothetical protein [Deinococcus soli (ex Cha et al. 2016)]